MSSIRAVYNSCPSVKVLIPLGYKGKVIKNYLKNSKDLKNLNIETVDTGVNTSIARRIYKIKNKIYKGIS